MTDEQEHACEIIKYTATRVFRSKLSGKHHQIIFEKNLTGYKVQVGCITGFNIDGENNILKVWHLIESTDEYVNWYSIPTKWTIEIDEARPINNYLKAAGHWSHHCRAMEILKEEYNAKQNIPFTPFFKKPETKKEKKLSDMQGQIDKMKAEKKKRDTPFWMR